MAKLGDAKTVGSISVEVQAKVTIPEETAEQCCCLLEMYLNADEGRTLFIDYSPEKGHKLRLVTEE